MKKLEHRIKIVGYPGGHIMLDRVARDLLDQKGHVVLYESPMFGAIGPYDGEAVHNLKLETVTLRKCERSDAALMCRVSVGDVTKLSSWVEPLKEEKALFRVQERMRLAEEFRAVWNDEFIVIDAFLKGIL